MRLGIGLGLVFAISACVYSAPQSSQPLPSVQSADAYYIGLCEARASALKTDPAAAQADAFEPAIAWLNEQCMALGFDMQPAATAQQTETFGPLTTFIGKAYKGESTGDSAEKITDFQYWSWALGGTAILIQHVIADGSYGGDTYIYKDAETGKLVYVYITNMGFRTFSEIQFQPDGSYTTQEAVTGHASITSVRSTTRINADGTSVMTSQYLDNGTWVPGAGFNYAPTEEPMPDFKAKGVTPEAPAAPEEPIEPTTP